MTYDSKDRQPPSGHAARSVERERRPTGAPAAGRESNATESGGISRHRFSIAVIGFFVALTAVRLAILAFGVLELSGDEAHYWEWSRRLDWCYYSKPPGVACLIRAGTFLFGNTELGVRFFAPVLSLLSSLVLYHLGRRLYDRRVGLVAAVLFQIMPMISAFGLGITPDTPLIFFWLLSLYFLHRAWSQGAPSDWLLLAVAVGLGLLSKYAVAFLYLPGALLLLTTPQGRQRLRTPWPYLSTVLSLLFFLPVIVWNSRHDWVMFRHDLGHAKSTAGWSLSPGDFLGFVGGQLGAVTPIVCVLMLYLLIRRRREDPFCFWLTIPILAIFVFKSLGGKVQPNWPLVGWLAGLVPLADFLVHHYRPLRIGHKRLVTAGLIIPAVGTLLLHVPFLTLRLPWPQGKNPLKRLIGWRQLGAEVAAAARDMDQPFFILADYYMTASELAFYTDGHPRVYCVNLGRRMNQYDIWSGLDDLKGRQALYVTEDAMPPDLANAFKHLEPRSIPVHDPSGRPVKTFSLYRCRGFKGWTARTPTHY